MQVSEQGNKSRRHELDESLVGHQTWKLASPVASDIIGVEGLEVTVAGLVKGNQYRHDFALAQTSFAVTLAGFDGAGLEGGHELLTEIVYFAEQMQ